MRRQPEPKPDPSEWDEREILLRLLNETTKVRTFVQVWFIATLIGFGIALVAAIERG